MRRTAAPLLVSSAVLALGLLLPSIGAPPRALADTPASPSAAAGVEENLGQPVTGLTNASAGYTETADGRDIGLVVAGGSPSMFSAVDIVTGELLFSEEIGSSMTWGFATTPDRKVYSSDASGQVYVFDPDALTLTHLADKPFGETYFWNAEVGDDGVVYFGSYPNGKVISYHPATKEWHDHGTQAADNAYARSIEVDGKYVYVGTGTKPTVTRLDTQTDEVVEIGLPDGYEGQEFISDIDIAGDLLFARPTPSADVLVYSLTEQKWVDTIVGGGGMTASPLVTTTDSGTERQEVIIVLQKGGSIAYDVETRERRTVSLHLNGASSRGFGYQAVDVDGFPGKSLITATSKAIFHLWNPETGETRSIASKAAPTPYIIRSLATGPDGDVWVGAYASPPGVARTDADSGVTEQLAMSGQVEGMAVLGDHLVFGTYTGGWLQSYDSTQPWQNGTNPGNKVKIGHEQDRPVAMTAVGDRVAVGSVPAYGKLGGALTFYDPKTGQTEVHEKLITDQTVISLTTKDGLLYGGTGIWGGLGVEPTTTEGQLFVYDPATDEVTSRTIPVPGAQNVSGLAFDDEGFLWGITANDLFKVDPTTMEVGWQKKYFNATDTGAYWTTRDLFFHEGRLVGVTGNTLFEVDPATGEMTVLQEGVQNLAIDRNGNYYYSRNSTLHRWVPDAAAGCDQTLTGSQGDVSVKQGLTCLTDAVVRGDVTVAVGAGIRIVDSTVQGVLRTDGASEVTARSSRLLGGGELVGTAGETVVSGSLIAGDLTCSGNVSAPTDEGVANRGGGLRSGQCAGL